MSTTPETFTGHWCDQDQGIVDPVPVYECSSCGERSDERRCTTCNKFMARDGDGCPECFSEVEDVELTIDHDGSTIRLEDFDSAGPAFAAREKSADEARAKALAAARAQKNTDAINGSHETTWASVRPGDRVLESEPPIEGTAIASHVVLNVRTAGPDATGVPAGSIIAAIERYGVSVTVHPADTVVRVMTGERVTSDEMKPASERVTINHDPHLWGGSGPRNITLRTGRGGFSLNDTPVAAIQGTLTPASGLISTLGAFTDPDDAQVYAHAARQVAEYLDVDGGRRPSYSDVTFTVEHDSFVSANLTRWVTFSQGDDEGNKIVEIRTEERQGRGAFASSVTDRLAMIAIAEAAEKAAEWLRAQFGLHD